MSTPTSQAKITEIQQLITGLQKVAPNVILTIAAQTYTTAQIIAILQSLITTATAVTTAKTAYSDAVQTNDKAETQHAPLVSLLRQQLATMYATAATTLAEFGLKPRKAPKPLTGPEIAARSAKAAATRKARGTTSKKQKAAISGGVGGVTITPYPAAGGASASPPASNTPTVAATSATPAQVPAAPASPSSASTPTPAAAATPHS